MPATQAAQNSPSDRSGDVDRCSRSRWTNYHEQSEALCGPRKFLKFKLHRVASRFRRAGAEVSVRTPFAIHPLILRNRASDNNVFSQIFIHREYRCLDHVREAQLIIDCGANVGYSSTYFLSRYPSARVVAVEPHAGNFEVLERNVAPYGNRCTTVRAGVWSTSTGLMVSEHPMGDWAVTVRPAQPGETAEIEAVDIGTLLAESGADRISILKVDIEGSESEVFSRNTRSWIDKFDHLVIELHGQVCRDVVNSAIDLDKFDVSVCEELTVYSRRTNGRSATPPLPR